MKNKVAALVVAVGVCGLSGCAFVDSSGDTIPADTRVKDASLDKNDTVSQYEQDMKKGRVNLMLFEHRNEFPDDYTFRAQIKDSLGVSPSQSFVSYCNGYGCMVVNGLNDNEAWVSVSGDSIASVSKMVNRE